MLYYYSSDYLCITVLSMIPISAQIYDTEVKATLFAWCEHKGRSFPWRRRDWFKNHEEYHGVIGDPWLVVVSEIMLQQTQTSRVVEKLPIFLELFPSVEALAQASKADLLRAWQGMGYNNRALRLKATAEIVVNEHGGAFPDDLKSLRLLPGIGRYTASAILCFAFGKDVPVVDVNVARVLSRIFFKCYSLEQRLREDDLYDIDAYLLPLGDSYRWHQGLMDFGATVCTARTPTCDTCPLNHLCLSSEVHLGHRLYHPSQSRSPEPLIFGEPRRIWRGRTVEILRSQSDGAVVADLLQLLFSLRKGLSTVLEKERRQLIESIQGLLRDGVIERVGQVSEEREIMLTDRIQLPE